MKKIGIIGGLGPMATVYYLELLTRMVDRLLLQDEIKQINKKQN